MPALTRIFGYFPAKLLRLGEDIPAGIALQWAARRSPEFRPEATASDASRARLMMARYEAVSGPALVIGFPDDAFATAAGIRRLLTGFPGLRADVSVIKPSDVGMKAIGHFGFFRREAATALWPNVVPFVEQAPASSKSEGPNH
jgi:predicted alpha/beta hydrolase